MIRKVRALYVRTEETAPFYDWCAVLGVSSLVFLALCIIAFVQYDALDAHDTDPTTDTRTQTLFDENKAAQVLTLYRDKKQRFDTRASMSVVIPDIGAMPTERALVTASTTDIDVVTPTVSTGTERVVPVE